MNANINAEYLNALGKLEALNKLSLRLLEIINISGIEEILLLMSERQELVNELCELDVFNKRLLEGEITTLPLVINNEFNKLLTTGEVLIKCCNQRLKDIDQEKRQSVVDETTSLTYNHQTTTGISGSLSDI